MVEYLAKFIAKTESKLILRNECGFTTYGGAS